MASAGASTRHPTRSSLSCGPRVAPHFLDRSSEDLEGISLTLTDGATLTARHGILASALSGMDIAIRDLQSRTRGLPRLWQDLARAGPGYARLYASGGLYGDGKTDEDLLPNLWRWPSTGLSL